MHPFLNLITSKVAAFFSTSPIDTPQLGDMVDGLTVRDFEHAPAAAKDSEPLYVILDYEERRRVSTLVRTGDDRWYSTGRYGFTHQTAEYLGELGQWDLFIQWADFEKGRQYVAVHADGREERELFSHVDDKTPRPILAARQKAKELERVDS